VQLRNTQEVATVDFDVNVSIDDLLAREATDEVRSDYLNTRTPKSLMTHLTYAALLLTAKKRRARPAAKAVSRGDAVVRILSAAVASMFKNEGLPAEPSRADIDAKLREYKSSN
jgi:hypothetical protein